jgi:transposase-like protein
MTPKERKRIQFTPQQKLQVLEEWKREGNGITISEKYQLHPATLYRWKKALEQGAQIFLSGKKPKIDTYVRKLEKENRKLKEVLTLQTQELMLLKKEMNLV